MSCYSTRRGFSLLEYERLKSIGMAYARVPNQSDVHSSESAAMRSESAAVELPDDAKGSGEKAYALRDLDSRSFGSRDQERS